MTPESSANYDLCYRCHDRGTLLRDQDGTFPHRKHVVEERAPCAVCHDAHGSRQYPHLINFMTRDVNGATVVRPTQAGRLQYVPTGVGGGTCYLTCHGEEHGPQTRALPARRR